MAGSADDIMKELMDKYNSQLNDSKKYQQDLKDSLDYNIRFAIDESELNKLQSIEEGIYKKQQEELNKISIMEINHQKEMNEWLIKNSVFQNKANQDFAKTRLEDAKKLYKLQTDTSAEYYRKLDEREARIYERANKNNRSLNETELKLLKRIEKERLNISKNVEETEKHSFINLKDVAKTAITDLFKFASNSFDTYIFNNIKAGITELSSNYEQNFTQIAGRIGSSSRSATHEFIGDILSTTNDNKYTKQGLNFNKDVFPEITNAVKNGFTGENAENIAISNAIDKKIMPWLDTTSETWVQMQYNMSNDALQQIKGQQLLLQATQEGNRILQNGVVSNITDALLPSLDNIVANTTDVEDFNIEMQAKAMYLMENGYTKQEAIKAINKEINAYQNPYKAITSNDVGDKLLALGHITGNDLLGSFASSMIGSGWVGSGAFAELTGIATGGETRSERSLKVYANEEQGIKKYLDLLKNKSKDEIEQLYKNTIEKLPEYVTATQAYDNKMQNQWAENTYVMNSIIHGNELQKALLDEVIKAKNGIIAAISTVTVSNLFNKSNLLSKGISNLFNNGNIPSNISKFTQFNTSGKGITLNALTAIGGGLLSTYANNNIQKDNEIINSSESSLSEKNLAKKDKNADTVAKYTGMGAAAAGTVATTAGIASSIGIAGAAGVAAVAGPIGWALLAAGGIALGAKEIYDTTHKIGGATKDIEKAFEEQKISIRNSTQNNINTLTNILSNLQNSTIIQQDLEEQRNSLIKSGLLSSSDELKARSANKEELEKLTAAYIKSSNSFSADVQKQLNDQMIENVAWSNDTWSGIINAFQDFNDDKNGKNRTKEYLETFSTIMSYAYADLNKKDINSLDKESQKIYKKLKSGFSDGTLDYSEANAILDSGWANTDILGLDLDTSTIQQMMTILSSQDDETSKYVLSKTNSKHKYVDESEITEVSKYLMGAKNATDVDGAKEQLDLFKKAGYKLSNYPKQKKLLQDKWKNEINLNEYRIGSTSIPYDMIAEVHANERVLTDNQNKEYTEQLITGKTTTNIIELGLQDVVNAISKQTQDIISYLNQLSFNNRPSTSSVNMLSEMGNTRVII